MSSKNVVRPDPPPAAARASFPSSAPGPLGRILVTGHPHPGSPALDYAQRIAEVHGAKLDPVPTEVLTAGGTGLVVVERQGMAAALPGSLQHKLLARTSGAVLLVPPKAQPLPKHPPLFHSVLCAVDFSDSLGAALAFVGSFGGGAERVTVLHVVPDGFPGEYAHGRYHFAPNQLEPHLEQEGRAVLERLAGPLDARFELVVTVAKPVREIHRLEKQLAPDLLVLAGPFETGTLHHAASQAVCPLLFLPGLPAA